MKVKELVERYLSGEEAVLPDKVDSAWFSYYDTSGIERPACRYQCKIQINAGGVFKDDFNAISECTVARYFGTKSDMMALEPVSLEELRKRDEIAAVTKQ